MARFKSDRLSSSKWRNLGMTLVGKDLLMLFTLTYASLDDRWKEIQQYEDAGTGSMATKITETTHNSSTTRSSSQANPFLFLLFPA